MADIRIKDLATTASTTASDDFLAVDGTTNGTRKLSAATPSFATSVTVPGVAGPTSTDLTLTGGSTGASLVLGQGTTAANVTLNATTSGFLSFTKSEDSSAPTLARLLNAGATTAGRYNEVIFGKSLVNGGAGTLGYKSDSATPANSRLYLVHYGNNQDTGGINLTNTGNLLIGTSTSPASYGKLVVSGGMTTSDDANGKLVVGRYSAGVPNSYIKLGALSTSLRITNAADSADLVTILDGGNVLIGGTTDIPGSGGLKVFGTTAASSTTTGALQVAGGVGVAGTGFFGSNVVSSGYFSAAPGTGDFRFNQQSFQRAAFAMGGSHIGYGYNSRYDGSSATVPATDSTGTMSSIASTASGISIFTNTSQVANTPGIERLSVSSAGIVTVPLSTASTGAGTGALQVAGGIYAGAASYFADTITAVKSLNGDFSNFITNVNAGTASEATLYISNAGTGATSATLGVTGTGYTTTGGFVQDAGVVSSGTGLSGGLSIMARAASSDIRFYAGAHTNLVATLASTGAATFAGAVAIGNTVNTVSPTSPNRTVTMVIGGVTYYLAAKTTND